MMSDSGVLAPSFLPLHECTPDISFDDGLETENLPGFFGAILNDVLSSDNPAFDEEDNKKLLSCDTEAGGDMDPTLAALQYLAGSVTRECICPLC